MLTIMRTTKTIVETGLLVGLLALAPALSALNSQAPATGQPAGTADAERIALGRLSYRIHCATCHGESGRGDGPMAEYLKVPPTDLTRLAVSRNRRFPRDEVYEAIDGRRAVRGHGPAAMPVWGATFQDRGRDTPQEQEVREKVLDLVVYIESVQAVR
jgi:mono/diheme cytochrome c family protein